MSLVFPGLTCRICAGSSSLFGVYCMRQRNGLRALIPLNKFSINIIFNWNLYKPLQCLALMDIFSLITVIPRLTKIIRSGITFVSRNTYTDGKDKVLEWPDRSCLLLYVSARIH